MQKIVNQFEVERKKGKHGKDDSDSSPENGISEDLGTLLHLLDTYSKNLLDIENHPVRKTRDQIDQLMKNLVHTENLTESLFEVRQFFSSYRIDEYSFVQKSMEEFRHIIWALADQLSEDLSDQRKSDLEIKKNLEQLREAVESNSLENLKKQSKVFIDQYTKAQSTREKRQVKRMDNIKKNLDSVKKQLVDANNSMRQDHLTGAMNRKAFEEQFKQQWNYYQFSKVPVTLIILDIDYFKKINDNYGHPMGDFILQECVRVLKEQFTREQDIVARIGGEEFAVLLPQYSVEHAIVKAENALQRLRNETYVKDDLRLKFTASMGIAQLLENEDTDAWLKRADLALYDSKNSGRNKYTVAPENILKATG